MIEPKQSIWERSWDWQTPALQFWKRLWAAARKVLAFLTLRTLVFMTACMATFVALFYAVENWRGKTAWEKHKREMAVKGVNLDWDSYIATNSHLRVKAESEEVSLVRSVLQRSVVVVTTNAPGFPLSPYHLAFSHLTWPPTFEEMQRLRKHSADQITRERLIEHGGKPVEFDASAFLGKPAHEAAIALAAKSGLSIEVVVERRYLGGNSVLREEMLKSLQGMDSLDVIKLLVESSALTLVPSETRGTFYLKQDTSLDSFRAWYALHEPLLDKLFTGIMAKGMKLDANLQDPLRSAIPSYVAVRTLVQGLTAGAQFAVVDGNPDMAILYVRRILELTKLLKDGHWHLMAVMIESPSLYMSGQPIFGGLQTGAFRAKHLAQLKEMYGEINLIRDYVRSVDEGERLHRAFGMEHFTRGDLIWMFGDSKLVDEKGLNWFHIALKYVPRGWVYQNLVNFDEVSQKFMDTIHLETDEVDTGLIDRYATELGQHEKDNSPYFFLAGRSIIDHRGVLQAMLMHQSAVHQLIIACALEEYLLQRGKYPEKLDELMPQYLAKIPRDVVDGKPMRYRREVQDSFVLYSVGWNRKDEGGVVKETTNVKTFPHFGFTYASKDKTQGDWVFRSKPLVVP
ncbi:MAG: hypothetical protein K0Q55_1265 [Verrucomicrobia bacterium]|jgi:hypothetical protein|nr:hypothetical protein [Verrucomicrobiota bacterium]